MWSERWGGLRWVDMLAGDVLALRADGTIERRDVGTIAAAVRPRSRGGAVIGVERGFALEEPDGSLTRLDELWSDPGLRMNEGGCDPDGRFYCGSMAYDRTPGAASVHRLDPDGSTTVVIEGVTISNGIDWSPGGTLAYYVDTDTERIDVFDYDSESGLTGRRTFVALEEGRPDGLVVDSECGVWVAANRTGTVHHYTSSGVLDEVVEVPPRQVTACTLGGERLDQLFITTSREGLTAGEDLLAGSVFVADVGVPGLPVREFAG